MSCLLWRSAGPALPAWRAGPLVSGITGVMGVMGRLVMVAPASGGSARAAASLGNAGVSALVAPAICMADAVFRWLPVLLCDVEAK